MPLTRRPNLRKRWGYGMRDLAILFGVSESTIRSRLQHQGIKPEDFQRVILFWSEQTKLTEKSNG